MSYKYASEVYDFASYPIEPVSPNSDFKDMIKSSSHLKAIKEKIESAPTKDKAAIIESMIDKDPLVGFAINRDPSMFHVLINDPDQWKKESNAYIRRYKHLFELDYDYSYDSDKGKKTMTLIVEASISWMRSKIVESVIPLEDQLRILTNQYPCYIANSGRESFFGVELPKVAIPDGSGFEAVFGPFFIPVNIYANVAPMPSTRVFTTGGDDDEYWVIHPHVQAFSSPEHDEDYCPLYGCGICLGTESSVFGSVSSRGDVLQCINIIESALLSYNNDSPYYDMYTFYPKRVASEVFDEMSFSAETYTSFNADGISNRAPDSVTSMRRSLYMATKPGNAFEGRIPFDFFGMEISLTPDEIATVKYSPLGFIRLMMDTVLPLMTIGTYGFLKALARDQFGGDYRKARDSFYDHISSLMTEGFQINQNSYTGRYLNDDQAQKQVNRQANINLDLSEATAGF